MALTSYAYYQWIDITVRLISSSAIFWSDLGIITRQDLFTLTWMLKGMLTKFLCKKRLDKKAIFKMMLERRGIYSMDFQGTGTLREGIRSGMKSRSHSR